MPRKTKATKTSPVVEATPAPEPINEVVEEVAAPETSIPSIGDAFTALTAQLTALRSQISSINRELKELRTRAEREIKQASKTARKRSKNTSGEPTGFAKPTRISADLAKFLGVEKGTEIARTSVTQEIKKYIKSNKLSKEGNGRFFHPDKKLRKLMRLGNDVNEISYFNLQTYMKHHFATKANPNV